MSFWGAPNREGLGGPHPCPCGGELLIVKGLGAAPNGEGLGGAMSKGLALPRLPRTCFLPLAKLGPLRVPRWRLSNPQRRL